MKSENEPVTALAEAVPAVPTAEERAAAEAEWNTKIDEFVNRTKTMLKDIIVLHWEEGQFVARVSANKARYGEQLVEKYVQSCLDRGMSTSASTVYKCLDFHAKYSREQVQLLLDKGITWHQVTNALLPIPDAEMREEFVEQIAEKKFKNEDDLKEAAQKVAQKARKESGATVKRKKTDKAPPGAAQAKVVCRSTIAVCSDMGKKLDEFKDTMKLIAKMEEGKQKSELLISVRDAVAALVQMSKRAQALVDLRDKLI
jgi:hypothetical protein